MLVALFAAGFLASQSPSVRVERSRDTVASAGEGVSTTLDTNGPTNAQTPIDAERAFTEDAKKLGQWTAFRKWAAPDAVMFVPKPENAQEWLNDRKDPAKPIDWWPTASYVSCDGTFAVNTGGWKRPDGSVGYFTTIWRQIPEGNWRWILDSGDTTSAERDRPAKPTVRKATCSGPPLGQPAYQEVGPPGSEVTENFGHSPDQSLSWHWLVRADGSRELSVAITTKRRVTSTGFEGGSRETVIRDHIAPPK